MHRRLWLLAGAAAAVLLLAASATATTKTAGTVRAADATPAAAPFAQSWANVPRTPAARKAKSVLVFGMEQDIDGFNSLLTCCNEYWAAVVGNTPVIRGAYVITDKLAYVPDLAAKIVATKTTLTYFIRPNANWNWGGKKVPVTYKDFAYTWKALVNPKNDVVGRDGYDQITGFTHKGNKVITFKWKKPYADYRDLFGIVYPSAALAGMDFNKIWANCVCGSNGKPVSDGPFMLTNYTKGQGATLKSNPMWYGSKQGLKEVDFKLITDTNSEIQAMRGGEVDAINPSPQTALTALRNQSSLVYSSIPGLYQEHVDIQFGKKGQPLLKAPWMRKAIAMGMNRAAVIKALFGDIAPGLTPLDNIVYYQSDKANYKPDWAKWNYNPAKALALLKANGCTGGPSTPTDGNTNYFTCKGYPAKFAYTTIAGNHRRETSEAIFKAELGAIGIQITDNLLPANVAFGPTVLSASNYDMFEFAWVTSPDPAGFVSIWGCGGESNYLTYCNRKATALLDASNSELNPAKRAQLFQKADVLMSNDVPTIPLYAAPTILVYKKAISGMKNNPASIGFSWNMEDWKWTS
jgi:peptide/nickel transport system substrate-binding protein